MSEVARLCPAPEPACPARRHDVTGARDDTVARIASTACCWRRRSRNSSIARPSCSTSAATRTGWRCSPTTSATGCRCGATSNTARPSANSPAAAATSTGSTRARRRSTRRVKQIETGIHWAEEPVSRISHLVSNVQIVEATPSVGRAARGRGQMPLPDLPQPGRDRDRHPGRQARGFAARGTATDWRIARRKIILDQNVLLSKNLTFFF